MFGTFLLIMSVIGTAAGMYSQYQYAAANKKAAEYQNKLAEAEAKAMETKAGQERASAQRAALEQKRRARLVSSRAESLVSAGGGDTGDISDQLGDIEREGEIRAQTAIYQGEESALGLEYGAQLTRAGGQGGIYAAQAESRAARMGALATGLSGLGSAAGLYAKYADPAELYNPDYINDYGYN